MIDAAWPGRGAFNYYATADATSWFLVVLASLGERATSDELEPARRSAGGWLANELDRSGGSAGSHLDRVRSRCDGARGRRHGGAGGPGHSSAGSCGPARSSGSARRPSSSRSPAPASSSRSSQTAGRPGRSERAGRSPTAGKVASSGPLRRRSAARSERAPWPPRPRDSWPAPRSGGRSGAARRPR